MNRTLVSFTLLALTSATCLAQESSTTNLVEQETSLSTTAITKPATQKSTLLQHGLNSIGHFATLVITLRFLAPMTQDYSEAVKQSSLLTCGCIFLYIIFINTVFCYLLYIYFAKKFTSTQQSSSDKNQATLTQCFADSLITALIAICLVYFFGNLNHLKFYEFPNIGIICVLTFVFSGMICISYIPYYKEPEINLSLIHI